MTLFRANCGRGLHGALVHWCVLARLVRHGWALVTNSVALSLSCKQPWVFLLASKRMCQTGNINPVVDVPGHFFHFVSRRQDCLRG